MERPIKSEIKGANRKIINQKYNIALKKYNDWKKSQKPKPKDPRPVWKKGETREEYRERLLPWRERQKKPKEYISPRDRKFKSQKLKIKKESSESINEYVSKHKNEKGITKMTYPVQTGKVRGEEEKIEKKDKPFENKVTGGGESKTPKLDAKIAEGKKSNEEPKVAEKKQPKLIKKKKGKGFVSTKSARGKQLLKIEERKRKLREKRFGKK